MLVRDVYIYALHHIIHIINYAFFVSCCMLMHIGLLEGITLLEFEAVEEEDQQEAQQPIAPEGEEQVLEDLPKCPDHKPSSYLKGKPRSIISLLHFTNINLSPLCLMH